MDVLAQEVLVQFENRYCHYVIAPSCELVHYLLCTCIVYCSVIQLTLKDLSVLFEQPMFIT